jgi:outer membrane protein OmpA-like peptidoglycan-associated protein
LYQASPDDYSTRSIFYLYFFRVLPVKSEMRAILLVFLFSCIVGLVSAQNLVRNPGLETLKDGEIGFRGVSGTPDIASKENKVIQYPPYYNSYRADLPTRSVDTIQFGDICICQWFSYTSSELTQAELRKPLKKNREYVVSLYTIKASVMEPPIQEVSVYFTKKRLPATREVYGLKDHSLTGERIPYLSLTAAASHPIASQERWVKVSGIYKAEGGERYLTIGNFIGANKAALEAMNSEGAEDFKNYKIKGTYYCYDNINVVPKSEATEEEEQLVPEDLETSAIQLNSSFAIGKTITLGDVNFATGDHQVLAVAFPTLDSLTAYMQKTPEAVVHIHGHTDSVGADEANLGLSVRRAQAVMDYLIRSGIAAERITFRGYGESLPKVVNDTDENRMLNRRVEIEIRHQ